MLAAAVDALERLLVEENLEFMLLCNLAHHNHQEHVLVYCSGNLREYGCALELVGRNLVMTCLKRNSKFVGLCLEVLHEGGHAGRNGTEVMVRQLLVLGRCMPDYGTVAKLQVRAGVEKGLVYKEVLLLKADVYGNALYALVKELGYGCSRNIQGLDRAQVGHLHIQCLSGIRYEYGRYTKCSVKDESGGVGVPCGIAPGLEGVAKAAVWEAGSVRFLLNQGAAFETLHRVSVLKGNESLMFFGRRACHRLEEVGVMGSSTLNCPGLHSGCNLVRNLAVDLVAGLTSLQHRTVGGIGHIFAHSFQREYVLAEVRGYRPVNRIMTLYIT